MPDARFFQTLAALPVAQLAARIGCEVVRAPDDLIIDGVAPLNQGQASALAFLADRKYLPALADTQAGAVILHPGMIDQAPAGPALLTSREPQAAWARAAMALHSPYELDSTPGVHPTARVEADVVLAAGVVIGAGAEIGRGTRIGANSVIGPGVAIGRDCWIGANVSVGFALIGDRVKLFSGVRIGEPGFGAAMSSRGPVDIPQLGRVILQDDVTVGANSCIDRGAYDDTVIGEGTKMDNLVMIGHNCHLGRGCLVAGHTGISGSVVVGDNVIFGGKAGVSDHLVIGDGARVAGAAGVLQDVPAGETWAGHPARPVRRFLRETAWLAKQAARKKGQADD